MKKNVTILLGLAPLLIALFSFSGQSPSAAVAHAAEQDSARAVLHHFATQVPSGAVSPQILAGQKVTRRSDQKYFLNRTVGSSTARIDTSQYAVNIVHPRDSLAANNIIKAIHDLPQMNKEFFTAFQENDGTGRAVTIIVSTDPEVQKAQDDLLKAFVNAIRDRQLMLDGLNKKIFYIGLIITLLAGVSAFLTAVYGSKGTRALVITVAVLALITSVLGFVSKDCSSRYTALVVNVERVRDMQDDYLQNFAKLAAVPKEMIMYAQVTMLKLEEAP